MSYTPYLTSSVGTGTTGPSVVILKASASATLTKNRVVTLSSGDADYTITLTGSPTLNDWFDQSVKTTASPSFAGLSLDFGTADNDLNITRVSTHNGAIALKTTGSGNRWKFGVNGNAESGGNAGSDFFIGRYADNTGFLGTALGIYRNTGVVQFGSYTAGAMSTDSTGIISATLGSGLQIQRTNAGATAVEWYTPASTLGGTVTSVSFTGGLISVATPTIAAAMTVAGTSGGVVYFDSASTWASSAALTSNSLVLGGGAGAAPKVVAGITTDGTSIINLGVNTTTIGKIKMFGNTSGDATIQPAAVAGTSTVITLPNVTSTLLPNTTTSGVGASPTSSSTTTITHGLGRIPTIIRVYGGGTFTASTSATPTVFSIGLYCSTGNACMYQPFDPSTITATEPMATNTSYSVRCDTGVGNFVTGVIGNVTATQFDIVWTETGTSTAQVYMWEAQ